MQQLHMSLSSLSVWFWKKNHQSFLQNFAQKWKTALMGQPISHIDFWSPKIYFQTNTITHKNWKIAMYILSYALWAVIVKNSLIGAKISKSFKWHSRVLIQSIFTWTQWYESVGISATIYHSAEKIPAKEGFLSKMADMFEGSFQEPP